MSGAPWDPGLQPERTELSWRRTSLSLAVGSVVAVRLLPDALGSLWWAVPGILGVIFSGALWVWSSRRYAPVTRTAVRGEDDPTIPDGALLLTVSAFVTAVGVLAIALVVVMALS